MPAVFQITAPAKLNLFLEVLGRRDDGYHDLETVITPISLGDVLRFQPRADGVLQVACGLAGRLRGRPAPMLQNEHNVAWHALERLRQRAGDPRLGGELRIDKQIPWEAGLGGGSSDAAAALQLANRAWNLDYSGETLAEIGALVGSDVPFFFAGGTAVCRGRGERVTPLPTHPPLWFVVVKPPRGLSTAQVFSSLPAARTRRSADPMVAEFRQPAFRSNSVHLYNCLRVGSCQRAPEIADVLRQIQATHPLRAEMTGSGSACYGLYPHRSAATRAQRLLAARLPESLVVACHSQTGTVAFSQSDLAKGFY